MLVAPNGSRPVELAHSHSVSRRGAPHGEMSPWGPFAPEPPEVGVLGLLQSRGPGAVGPAGAGRCVGAGGLSGAAHLSKNIRGLCVRVPRGSSVFSLTGRLWCPPPLCLHLFRIYLAPVVEHSA